LINVGENAVNIVLAVALVGAFGVTGLSAAFSVAYAVAAVLAFVVLHRRVGGLDVAGIGASLVRITVAATAMGVVVWLVAGLVGGTATVGEAVVRTAVGVVVGVLAYLGVLLLLRAPELASARGVLSRRSAGVS
jgi:putative peptidoglycan lipid II flippase